MYACPQLQYLYKRGQHLSATVLEHNHGLSQIGQSPEYISFKDILQGFTSMFVVDA